MSTKMQMQMQHPMKVTYLDLKQLDQHMHWLDLVEGMENWRTFRESVREYTATLENVLRRQGDLR